MPRHQIFGSIGGSVSQSAVPQRNGMGDHYGRMGGILLQGVVTATYVQRDGMRAYEEDVAPEMVAVYCDVLAYTTMEGASTVPLRRCLVAGGTSGLHDGRIWKPRATTMDLSGKTLSLEGSDPRDMDGDHVLVQFLEDDMARPVIVGRVTHPRMGFGNEDLTKPGQRMRLEVADGDPDFLKHHGSFYGVDKNGGFTVDTTRAHGGTLSSEGKEIPAQNVANGKISFDMNNATEFTVTSHDKNGNSKKVDIIFKDGLLRLRLNDTSTELVIDDDTLHVKIRDGDDADLVLNGGQFRATLQSGVEEAQTHLADRIFEIKFAGDNCAAFELAGASAQLTLGDGAENAVIWSVLATLIDLLEGHQHKVDGTTDTTTASDSVSTPLSGGVADPSPALVGLRAAFDAAKSSRITFPSG